MSMGPKEATACSVRLLRASASVDARPMPEDALVTSADFPFSS